MNKRAIAKILKESVFDKSGIMKVVCDVKDIHYYLNRAVEAIKRADSKFSPVTSLVPYDYDALTFAISCLALAKLEISERNAKAMDKINALSNTASNIPGNKKAN